MGTLYLHDCRDTVAEICGGVSYDVLARSEVKPRGELLWLGLFWFEAEDGGDWLWTEGGCSRGLKCLGVGCSGVW